MPFGELIDRATSNVGVSEKLKTVDEVIWDEASMSSASPVPELSFLPAAYRG